MPVEAVFRRNSRLIVARNLVVRVDSMKLSVYEYAKQNNLQASLYAHGMTKALAGALLVAVAGLE